RAGAESESLHGHPHDRARFIAHGTMTTDETHRHLGVAMHQLVPLEPSGLCGAGRHHPMPNRFRRFGLALRRELVERNGRDLDVQIDPIHQRPTDPLSIAIYLAGRTHTFLGLRSMKSTFAWI